MRREFLVPLLCCFCLFVVIFFNAKNVNFNFSASGDNIALNYCMYVLSMVLGIASNSFDFNELSFILLSHCLMIQGCKTSLCS